MSDTIKIALIIGSSPDALRSRNWAICARNQVVAINNAWRVRPDWQHLVHPKDFAAARMPQVVRPGQQVHSWQEYVPAQNLFGGFVYAGGTMAFTTAYWALNALRPEIMAFVGCDMVYPAVGPTHFYGMGTADPLRDDPTLQSLEAKSARLQVMAAEQGCICVNLSSLPESRLTFPRIEFSALTGLTAREHAGLRLQVLAGLDFAKARAALDHEAELGYYFEDGRYWRHFDEIDAGALAAIDRQWLGAAGQRGLLSAASQSI